jgi:hypothetical protein
MARILPAVVPTMAEEDTNRHERSIQPKLGDHPAMGLEAMTAIIDDFFKTKTCFNGV